MSKVDITIDKSGNDSDDVLKKPESKKNVVVWQCRHRNYQEILPMPDAKAEQTRSGGTPKVVVKARNWRIELDLNDPAQEKMHKYLLKRQPLNPEYYLLTDKTKGDKLSEEGSTLQKLLDMSMPQLMQCITDEELVGAGLHPGKTSRYELVALIMKKKKLV